MKTIIAATLMTLLTISGLYHVNFNSDSDSDFERWALKHSKNYLGDEKTYRQAIYYQNKQMIEEHNKRTDVTYLMGENQFTAITNEEFINLYLNPKPLETKNDKDQNQRETNSKSLEPNQEKKLQDGVDWRGLVPVKNQGNCASSWAIAATAVIEGEYAIKREFKLTLSAQQIMDCDKPHSDSGCNAYYQGNDVDTALWYVRFNGLFTEYYYPYIGRADQWCQKFMEQGPWTIDAHWSTGFDFFDYYLDKHPITTKVDASKWQFYSSGLFSDCSSSEKQANYYALVVGYDSSGNWFVQASFGKGWGESGYIRLTPGNTCGIKNQAYYVVIN